jgi:nucleotide-binding universal stress UspA family protein
MSKSSRCIVIGTSLSTESDHVVETGLALARADGAKVYLVHAYSPPASFVGVPAEYSAANEWWEVQRRDIEQRLAAQAHRTGAHEAGGRVVLEIGAPHQALLDTALAMRADLIVVGTHEESDHRWPRLGSTADRLIRKVNCPLLAVRPGSPFPPATVLAPVDFSDASESALRRGLDLLAGSGVSSLEALFVLNPLEQAGSLQFTPEQIARFATNELERFVASYGPAASGLRRCRVRTGYPAEEILAELAEVKADLVMLGTHGRSGLERMLIGSVAADVLQSAPCSVLILPPEMEEVEEKATKAAEKKDADWAHVARMNALPAM